MAGDSIRLDEQFVGSLDFAEFNPLADLCAGNQSLIESLRSGDFKLHSVLIAKHPQGLHVPNSTFSESEIRPLDDPSHTELSDKYPLKKLAWRLLKKLVGGRKEIDAVDPKPRQ
jgi:hypothetical protein